MKSTIKHFLCAALICGAAQGFAQNEVDALRYSQLNLSGTARFTSMGGAFGALGGDMSTMTINPAGIGVFTRTTGSISIGLTSSNTDGTYLGSTSSDGRVNFNLTNAGAVVRFKRKRGQDRQWSWKSFHLGVSFNRTANFNGRTSIVGANPSSSVVDVWVDGLNAQGIDYQNIPSEVIPGDPASPGFMGWQTFLIDTVPGSTTSYLRNVMPNYGQVQRVREQVTGGMSEANFTFGGNFGNALYFGATVGVPRLNYEMERTYTEQDARDTIANFGSFTKTDFLQASGNGINFKFGLIYRPVKWLRMGAAVHTPTYFDVDEAFSSILVSELDGVQFNQPTANGAFNYSLQTPFRAIGSLAFVIGKIGLVSADYEYVNYAMARFRSQNYSFDAENARVENRLNWGGNIRIGTEWRIKMLSIRGGFALNANPYTSQLNFDDTRYSLGLGIRLKRFYVDLAYDLHRINQSYEVYDVNYTPLAQVVTNVHSLITTVGFRF